MNRRVLVPIADGSEDIEAVTIIDVLRRAGAEVVVASVKPGDRQITAARGTRIVADCLLTECASQDFDLIALPGGLPGAEHLRDCDLLRQCLERQAGAGRLFAAICAAPAYVLAGQGLLQGRQATCYPSFRSQLPAVSEDPVVVDGGCVTSQGPGTALAFALTLVEELYGAELRRQLAQQMLVD